MARPRCRCDTDGGFRYIELMDYGQFGDAIHVIEADGTPPRRSKSNQLARHLWRQHLSTFVVTHIALGAADATPNLLLSDP